LKDLPDSPEEKPLAAEALLNLHRLRHGVLPFAEALRAIGIASEQQIAVLGLGGFGVREDGLLTVAMADASSYVRDAGN
jgi:hypothetical protein